MSSPGAAQKRTWRSAVLIAAALVAVAIAASALVNPPLGVSSTRTSSPS